MADSRDGSPGDNARNSDSRRSSDSGKEQDGTTQQQPRTQQDIPKAKRMACVLCRKRKLRCDGNRPSCATCVRLQHDCIYDEVRRKSGPRRGYVKKLEARLAQVEALLKTHDDVPNGTSVDAVAPVTHDMTPDFLAEANLQDAFPMNGLPGAQPTNTALPMATDEPFPWEMIGLGLDEPLPTGDVIQELNEVYFEKCHLSLPMVHRPRYHAAMNLAPHMRPPVCLRYAMWALAASVTEKYSALHEHFYQRARKYIQLDEMKSHGEPMITVAHCQTWILLATYEFKLMYFPRAWMSSGRATRMALMIGTHRLDGSGLDVKQCIPPPKDWTEREERRRTFWAAFSVDRYSSIGTGWPMVIDERDIKSNLPCDEESFELSKEPTSSITLEQALQLGAAPNLAAFSGSVVMACLFGRNLTHLHRPSAEDNDHDLNGEFWRRHLQIDNVLSNLAMALPSNLRLPAGMNDPNIIFLNMCIHTSTICLHQAAIFKADRNRMPPQVSLESKRRCITAARETASIMRQIVHIDMSGMNPFMAFSLYVAARVFVQYLRSRPKDAQVRSSLQFLLAAMHSLKRRNPLTESFLVQLDVDLESAGLEDTNDLRASLPHVNPEHTAHKSCSMAPDGNEFIDPLLGRDATNANMGNERFGNSMPTPSGADLSAMFTEMNGQGINNIPRFDLPNRQRTPGGSSLQGSSRVFEMDTSPDGSGDQRSPNSVTNNNVSSHSSNTGYSPQNAHTLLGQQHQSSQSKTTLHPNDVYNEHNIFSNNAFDLSGFAPQTNPPQASTNEFVLPQEWMNNATTTSINGTNSFTNSTAAAASSNVQAQPTGIASASSPNPGQRFGLNDLNGIEGINWDDVNNMDYSSMANMSSLWDTGAEYDASAHPPMNQMFPHFAKGMSSWGTSNQE